MLDFYVKGKKQENNLEVLYTCSLKDGKNNLIFVPALIF